MLQPGGPPLSPSPHSSAATRTSSPSLDESLFAHLAEDLTFAQDRKSETQRALLEELMESLRKEEKLLDADAWKYAAPRSQLHLTSMSGVILAKGDSASGNKQLKGDQQAIR